MTLLAKQPEGRPANALAVHALLCRDGVSWLPEKLRSANLPRVHPDIYSASLIGRDALLERCTRVVNRVAGGEIRDLEAAGIREVLRKPCSGSDLLHSVRSALDERE